MTYRYAFRYRTFSRYFGLTEKSVRVRAHSQHEAVRRFYEKYGKIKILSIDGKPFEEEKENGLYDHCSMP